MSFFGSLIDAGVSTVNNLMNLDFQERAIDQNMALTRESWARDDNAVQRRVADLKAAGLNPILAAGSAAGNSNPIKVEPKRVDFKSDFGSHDFNEDWQAVEALKSQRLDNKNRALQNSILDAQKTGIELDNDLKELNIAHYGESPTFKLISSAVEAATGKPIWEWVADLGRSLGWRDKETDPVPEVEDFVGKFVLSDQTNDYWTVRTGQVQFTSLGNALMREAANKLGLSFKEFSSIMEEAILKRIHSGTESKLDGSDPHSVTFPYPSGGGYAW